jgi:hypothetical protein
MFTNRPWLTRHRPAFPSLPPYELRPVRGAQRYKSVLHASISCGKSTLSICFVSYFLISQTLNQDQDKVLILYLTDRPLFTSHEISESITLDSRLGKCTPFLPLSYQCHDESKNLPSGNNERSDVRSGRFYGMSQPARFRKTKRRGGGFMALRSQHDAAA